MDHLEGHSAINTSKHRKFIDNNIGTVVQVRLLEDGLDIATSSGSLIYVNLCRANMFNIRVYPLGEVIEPNGYMIDENYKVQKVAFDYESNKKNSVLTTSDATLVLEHEPFRIRINDKSGKTIFCTQGDISWNDRQLFFDIEANEDVTYYGTGLRRVYPLNNNTINHRIERNTWDGKSTPFFISSCRYGFFLNTSLWDTSFEFKDSIECMIPRCELLDCYIVIGDMPKIIKTYHELVGATLMPPKWSLGYWNGRYSYRTQEELLDNAKKFREKNIPCDLIFLDLMWRGVYIPMEETDLTWDYECFPEPKKMIGELADMDFHLFTHVNTTSNVDARDFTNPANQKDWHDKIVPLIKEGAQGFMIDGGEGKGMNDNFMSWNVPSGKYYNGMYPEEMANIWGLLYNKTVVCSMQEARPNERMFGLTRAATAGSQKYGVIWSGDHESEWHVLKEEMVAGMQMSLSGFPFWTFDIGGISGKPKGDLFLRWLQVGCFVPVARTHGQFPKEPWLYGKTIEEASRKILNFRMKMIPYLYSIAYEMHKDGTPMSRPLVWHYPDDERCKNIWDEWTLGRDLLVAPIYEENTFNRSVYLPEGEWIELSSGKTYSGNEDIKVDAPLDAVPLFMRKGAIFPMCKAHNHTKVDIKELDVYIYPDSDSSFVLYEDDGITSNYKSEHSVTEIKCNINDGVTNISVSKLSNGYADRVTQYNLLIVTDDVKSIKVQDVERTVEYKYDKVLDRTLLYIPIDISEADSYEVEF